MFREFDTCRWCGINPFEEIRRGLLLCGPCAASFDGARVFEAEDSLKRAWDVLVKQRKTREIAEITKASMLAVEASEELRSAMFWFSKTDRYLDPRQVVNRRKRWYETKDQVTEFFKEARLLRRGPFSYTALRAG